MEVLRRRARVEGGERGGREGGDSGGGAGAVSAVPGPSTLVGAGGHINLFEDLEKARRVLLYIFAIFTDCMHFADAVDRLYAALSHLTLQSAMVAPVRSTRGPRGRAQAQGEDGDVRETDKGVALAPSKKDLNPWYSDKGHERNRELPEDKKCAFCLIVCLSNPLIVFFGHRLRDIARKSAHDPLTSINTQLASRQGPPPPPPRRARPPPRSSDEVVAGPVQAKSGVAERLSRESSERQRALELIRRKKREAAGSETPSTVHGGMGDGGYGYGDVFNRREVEEVQRAKRRDRDWDRDRGFGSSRRRW